VSRVEKAIVAAATLVLLIAFLARLYTRGGPYFERPETIVDHVGPTKHETRDALALLPKVRPLLPRGARVTCFRPNANDPNPDFFAAVGQLPQQTVVPSTDTSAEYAVVIWVPIQGSRYRLLASFYEGRLYKIEP
jgi:hypothetical protein